MSARVTVGDLRTRLTAPFCPVSPEAALPPPTAAFKLPVKGRTRRQLLKNESLRAGGMDLYT